MTLHNTRTFVLTTCLAIIASVSLLTITGVAGATGLPDNRVYELVSPPDKNGGDLIADSSRTHAAADGSAVVFSSLAGFGDVQGTGIATDYLAQRSTSQTPGNNGWSTHAITPPQQPLSFLQAINGFDPSFRGEFSPDLSRAVFRAVSPVGTPDPNVEQVPNLYTASGLRNPGEAAFSLASGCPLCETSETPLPAATDVGALPWLAGTSSDFSHVLFESRQQLTEDSPPPGTARLYEWVEGVGVRLAGVLPDGTAAPVSVAGQGAGASAAASYTPHTISNDGSRVFFTDPSTDSARLYMRTDGDETVQIDASERTVPDAPAPSIFQDASSDGSRAFFITKSALTDDAPVGNVGKLYMYDADAPAGQHLTLLSADHEPADGAQLEPNIAGVLGTSEDGHYVYFTARGQLVAGQPTLGLSTGLYVWHDDSGPPIVEYIGKLAENDGGDEGDLLWGINWNIGARQVAVTPDGRSLVFTSRSGQGLLSAHGKTDYDQTACPQTGSGRGCREVYVYSTETGELACASCNPDGSPATGSASIRVRFNNGGSVANTGLSRAISDDGRFVFFTTPEALVPEDVNGHLDVYEYDVLEGTTRLISSGRDPADSYFMDASADGSDVFFLTREALVGWDRDQAYDVYDARINGGFPEPPPITPECSSEGCQGSQSTPPVFTGAGSFSFAGAGNETPSTVRGKSVVRGANAKRLASALRACRKEPKSRRKRCESRARTRYAGKASKNGRNK